MREWLPTGRRPGYTGLQYPAWGGPEDQADSGGLNMGILTDDMKRVVRQQRMGFMATVCPDG